MAKPGRNKSTRNRKRRPQQISRKSVLKMLAVMSETGEEGKSLVEDFLTTGRTGRRNALPDIMHDHALTSTSDLPDKIAKLSTKDPSQGTSSESTQPATESGKEGENDKGTAQR